MLTSLSIQDRDRTGDSPAHIVIIERGSLFTSYQLPSPLHRTDLTQPFGPLKRVSKVSASNTGCVGNGIFRTVIFGKGIFGV